MKEKGYRSGFTCLFYGAPGMGKTETVLQLVSIWHEMLPSLTDADVRILATKYDFSGGQIENIARHHAIDSILHGESSVSLETLMAHCDNERLEQKETRKIGYCF